MARSGLVQTRQLLLGEAKVESHLMAEELPRDEVTQRGEPFDQVATRCAGKDVVDARGTRAWRHPVAFPVPPVHVRELVGRWPSRRG